MLEWIINNKEWIFSGIGIFALGGIVAIIKLLTKRKKISSIISQKQKSGACSTNSQIGIQNNYGDKKDE